MTQLNTEFPTSEKKSKDHKIRLFPGEIRFPDSSDSPKLVSGSSQVLSFLSHLWEISFSDDQSLKSGSNSSKYSLSMNKSKRLIY